MLNRDAVKAGIVEREGDDPELTQAFANAKSLQVELATHKHAEVMKDKELGLIGKWLGGEKNATITVAAFALIISLLVFVGIHGVVAFATLDAAKVTSLISAADKCLALATLALGYVCGKGS